LGKSDVEHVWLWGYALFPEIFIIFNKNV
jgi:hypothetical protein